MSSVGRGGRLRQAVILAGGQATRLRPYTDDRPKILVEIAGQPILEHQARWLAAGGIEHVTVSSGYLADVLRQYVQTHSLPLSVEVLVEDEPLGRGGGFKFAAAALPYQGERWLGLNGDILTDMSIDEFHRDHEASRALASVAIAPLRSPYGIVHLDDVGDAISEFLEAPILPYWVNAGIYIFEADIRDLLPDKGDHEASTFPQLAKERRLHAFRIEGYWRGVDTAKDIKEAGVELSRPSRLSSS
jgi:NDP-sugar pyrophosphorylase family protein